MMRRLRLLVLAVCLGLMAAAPACAAVGAHSPNELADAVERRAGATDFGALERFGLAALARSDREGLNRIYHVTWIFLNQGEFDKARLWNGHLEAAAQSRHDGRYLMIARLNALSIRYDEGDETAATEIGTLSRTLTDWFDRVHAARLQALILTDGGQIGEALKLMTNIDAIIPDGDPYAATAHSGVWEVAGIAFMQLNDLEGATSAFGRFEIDYSNPAYPRPDFDTLFNMTKMALQVGDLPLAESLAQAHRRLSVRAGLAGLSVHDASLCAAVADARGDAPAVLKCLAPYGENLGAASFLAPRLLRHRAIAYARLGRLAAARRDLARFRTLENANVVRSAGFSEASRIEAEILFAEGRPAQAYTMMREYDRHATTLAARRFSAGIRQVTGDMQNQLDERRAQLETAKVNTALQRAMIRSQRWIVGIGMIFVLSAIAAMIWQHRLSGALRAARLRADLANASKSEFLANMSHEIRTPLNGIVAMADTLARANLAPRQQEMAEVIRSSGLTLERLLSDILDTAKIESGQVTIEPTPFDLGEAVRGVGMLWAPRAEEKGIELLVSLDPALNLTVIGDPVRFRQILTNLVSNALKFTEAGLVRVAGVLMPDGRMRFSVTDTGVGFDDAQKARVFARFQQADGTITRRFGGTGLGLAISRDLAELMGGSMDCASRPGEGASFWFDLPFEAAPEAMISGDRADDHAEPSAQGLRILLADDHPANRKVVEIMLAETGAFLTMVEDGQQALDTFAAEPFDLVLMDMQMPVMDGLSATRAIRAHEQERGLNPTPVIMLTANALAEHVRAGRAAGADGHLAKPITMATLFAAIEAALTRPAGAIGETRAA